MAGIIPQRGVCLCLPVGNNAECWLENVIWSSCESYLSELVKTTFDHVWKDFAPSGCDEIVLQPAGLLQTVSCCYHLAQSLMSASRLVDGESNLNRQLE